MSSICGHAIVPAGSELPLETLLSSARFCSALPITLAEAPLLTADTIRTTEGKQLRLAAVWVGVEGRGEGPQVTPTPGSNLVLTASHHLSGLLQHLNLPDPI